MFSDDWFVAECTLSFWKYDIAKICLDLCGDIEWEKTYLKVQKLKNKEKWKPAQKQMIEDVITDFESMNKLYINEAEQILSNNYPNHTQHKQ